MLCSIDNDYIYSTGNVFLLLVLLCYLCYLCYAVQFQVTNT